MQWVLNPERAEAGIANPQTAFTFAFLDLYQRLNLCGKLTMYDYFTVICQLTDNTGTVQVKVSCSALSSVRC